MNKELRIRNIKKSLRSIIHDSLFMIHSRGFTLIELLIVIAIVGVLSGFITANFIGVRQRGRDAVRKSDLQNIRSALEFYRSDWAEYPLPGTSCTNPLSKGTPPVTYLQAIPCDPVIDYPYNPMSSTNEDIEYYYSSDGTTYTLGACLENANDQGANTYSNSSVPSGMPVADCSADRFFVLQNP